MDESTHKLEWYEMDGLYDLPIYVQDKKVADCIDTIFSNLAVLEFLLKDKTDERSNFLRSYYLDGGWHKGLRWEGPTDPEMLPLSDEECRALAQMIEESLKTFRIEVEVDGETRLARDIRVADIQTAVISARMTPALQEGATSVVMRIQEVDAPAGEARD